MMEDYETEYARLLTELHEQSRELLRRYDIPEELEEPPEDTELCQCVCGNEFTRPAGSVRKTCSRQCACMLTLDLT